MTSAALVKSPGPSFRVSWFDRLLIGVAPRWGLRRVKARASAAMFGRYYEATAIGRRTSGWSRSSSDANPTMRDLEALRNLSRDLRRNNSWARRGIQAIVNNTVSWGIQPKVAGPNVDPELAKEVLDVWSQWARTPACDYDGRMPFYGLQRLVMETIVESGEALVVLEQANDSDGLPVPLRIRVLEPDYIDLSKDGPVSGEVVPTGHVIVQGIELDGRGRRVAYWLHRHHPGSAGGARLADPSGDESRRVPATEVLHIYQVDRPGLMHGVPWLASAISKLNDFDDYEDAVLMQQKIAACFGAFVQDFDGMSTPMGDAPDAPLPLESLEPGQIQYLPPGKTVTFASPPSVSDHMPFMSANLRRVATGLGVTYEDLTGDYSQVNFSSARMARMAHWANVHDWRWNMLIPQLCDGVWRWIMGFAAEVYGWPTRPRAEWAPPPMPMLEPEKEGLAYSRLVRNGAMTLNGMIRELGEDPESHLTEIQQCNAELDRRGIWLDCDPRRTSAAGLTQAPGAAPPTSGNEEGEEP